MKTTVCWASCDFPLCFFGFCADSGMEPRSDNAKANATSRLMLFVLWVMKLDVAAADGAARPHLACATTDGHAEAIRGSGLSAIFNRDAERARRRAVAGAGEPHGLRRSIRIDGDDGHRRNRTLDVQARDVVHVIEMALRASLAGRLRVEPERGAAGAGGVGSGVIRTGNGNLSA